MFANWSYDNVKLVVESAVFSSFLKFFKFNDSFLYSDSFEGVIGKNTDLLKLNIINYEKNYKKDKVENILKNKDLKLGNFNIKSNTINYNIKDLNYLPFLRLEVEEKKGDKKIEIIDYISRTIVSLSNK